MFVTASNNKLIGLIVIGLAAAGITGAVLLQRGPDLSVMPEMAAGAVSMPDGRVFYAQRHEVTISQWNKCAADKGCDLTLRARPGQNPDITPATGLNYPDARQYVRWINKTTQHAFRLPTAEEWRVMAEAVLPDKPDPIFTDPALRWASAYMVEGLTPRALKPQGSFSTSPEGIVDLDGSVWEWTMQCYAGAEKGIDPDRCPAFFVGGEHMAVIPYPVRDPARGGCAVGAPPPHLGMRLVSDDARKS